MSVIVKIIPDCKDGASCSILRGKMEHDGFEIRKEDEKDYDIDPFLGDHYGEKEFDNEKDADEYAKQFIKDNPTLMRQISYIIK